MASTQPVRILLQAPPLLAESLALQLTREQPGWAVALKPEQLKGRPSLLIWSIDAVSSLAAIDREARATGERWPSTPLLILLPDDLALSQDALLALPAAGLLQNSDLSDLHDAVTTLLDGGRVVRLSASPSHGSDRGTTMGLGQWLLVSGLQQISCDLQVIEALLIPPPKQPLLRLLLEGRRRELRSAHGLLLWLWGPLQLGLTDAVPLHPTTATPSTPPPIQHQPGSTAITLRQRNALAVWEAIQERITDSLDSGLINATGRLLALDGLNSLRRRELVLALLQQLEAVLHRLRDSSADHTQPDETWGQLQGELRRQALTDMAGSYVQLPRAGELLPVAQELLDHADLSSTDAELPNPSAMLAPLLAGQPVLVNGQLLPPDDPRALLQLEALVSNWLIRTAELIGSDLLDLCGEWPELRRYLLREELVSTRELERLRNQLNAQLRWEDWIQHPIDLYESKRTLFQLQSGRIVPIQRLEPRDEELSKLGWWQRQVALLLETRDALAPQLHALIQRLGDLLVVILTQVIGRGIGLIGRGIAQGMGRHLGRG
ncbi:MAG: DUF3685 domain-containing protein [Synechococcus sp.]